MIAWMVTDTEGRIEIVSREANELLGARFSRGTDLVEALTLPRRAALRDIEMALTGCPADRVLMIERFGRRRLVRYRVARRVPEHGRGLFWHFQLHYSVPSD